MSGDRDLLGSNPNVANMDSWMQMKSHVTPSGRDYGRPRITAIAYGGSTSISALVRR